MTLRTLTLLATTAPCVGAADPPAPSAKEVVERLQKAGAVVRADKKKPGEPVVMVSLTGAKAADADLAGVSALTDLDELVLSGPKLTDGCLAEVAKLPALRDLLLTRTAVTDAGLKQVAGMKALEKLVLDNTGVTDAGLKELHGLKTLKFLYLTGTPTTAAGVDALKQAVPGVKVYR